MATVNLHGNPPMTAAGNISPCRFIRITGEQQVQQCSSNAHVPFGISSDGARIPPNFVESLGGSITNFNAIAGEAVEYFGLGQYCLLQCGVAWTAGAFLMSHTDGTGAPATSTNPVGARALTGANVGERRIVQVLAGHANP